MLVKCFDDDASSQGLYRISVPTYARWAPLDAGMNVGSTIECYQYADAAEVDVLTVCGGIHTDRKK